MSRAQARRKRLPDQGCGVRCECVVDPSSAPGALDEACVAQHSEVIGEEVRGQVEVLLKVTVAADLWRQHLEDLEARRVGDRFENIDADGRRQFNRC